MKKYYSISIPKPCHEDWSIMTPQERGRFCDSCAKTVIDFTKMSDFEIQDFIDENKNEQICGHFKQTQLDSINLVIPSQILVHKRSFHKLFILALLIVMGTSLMNCINKNGEKQKINSIEIFDSINDQTISTLNDLPNIVENSNQNKACKFTQKKATSEKQELITETVGELNIDKYPPVEIDGLINITGDLIIEEESEDSILGFVVVDEPAEFENTPTKLSVSEKKEYFSKMMSKFILENFNQNVYPDLKGKQKIFTQFKIDEKGSIVDIKVRAPHIKLEQEAIRVIKLLPPFIPARQRDKPIAIEYTLPIIFEVEE